MAKKIQTKDPLPTVKKFSFKVFSDFVNTNFSLIILLVIAFILGFIGGSLWKENQILKSSKTVAAAAGNQAADDTAKKLEGVAAFDPKTDHYRGDPKAKVVFIEYSDYECPYCNKFHPIMKSLMDSHEKDIVWVYRHYPLSFHPNAQALAEASECVAAYGSNDAFWKFSDSVYEKMSDGSIYGTDATSKVVSEEMILSLAAAAGADRSKVQSCIDSNEMQQAVKDDQTSGSKVGVNGTPNTIIISKKGGYELIPGALPLDQIETMLANHL